MVAEMELGLIIRPHPTYIVSVSARSRVTHCCRYNQRGVPSRGTANQSAFFSWISNFKRRNFCFFFVKTHASLCMCSSVSWRGLEEACTSDVCVVLYNPHFRAHPPSSSQTFLLNTWELYKCVVNDNPVVHSSSTSQPIRSVHCSFILNSHTWTECVHQIFSRRHFTLDSISYLSTCQISDMVVLSLVVQ